MQASLLNKLKEAFESNPDAKLVYQTLDGQCFLKPGDASHHSRTLANTPFEGSPSKVYRDQVAELEKSLDNEQSNGNGGEVVKPLDRMNKVELQAECTRLEIEFTEEETKAELIAKIESKNNNQ